MPIEVIGQEGGIVSNNFVVNMNNTTNNTASTGGPKEAGPYQISLASGDTSFDIYLINANGESVGYSNSGSINATGPFELVCILGVSSTEIITFNYSGSINNPSAAGQEIGAGAYLETITPADLPNADDTATVTGGNFASDVQITFESGATVLSAKNIVVNSSTELLVTRPDALIEDNSPYTLKAVNPGVNPPIGSNAHLIVDGVTAGGDPTWVTTSPLPVATFDSAYSETIEATDVESSVSYAVTSGSLPAGLSLNSSTGEISGTPTDSGSVFTVTATDEGGNTSSREFALGVAAASGGTISVFDDAKILHVFNTTDDFQAFREITNVEYLVVAGGGGNGESFGGAGGYRSSVVGEPSGGGEDAESTLTVPIGTYTVEVGAGGSGNSSGSSSVFHNVSTVGGGNGATSTPAPGGDGGSGGGAKANGSSGRAGGSGTPGEGFNGGGANYDFGRGGGGGAAQAGAYGGDGGANTAGKGGDGVTSSITGTAISRAGGAGSPNGLGQSGPGGAGKAGQVVVRYI